MTNPKLRFKKSDGSEYSDWYSQSFGETFSLLPNNTLARNELVYNREGIKNIHYGDILTLYGNCIDASNDLIPVIRQSKKICDLNEVKLKNGDVIIADTAEDDMVGKTIEITNCTNEILISGLHTIACRPREEKFAPKFLGYYLNSSSFHNQLRPLMQGIKVISIGRIALSKETSLSIPCYEEQQQIANFFSKIDETIEATEKEIQDLELAKKGEMQKIFSQKVRFKASDGSEYPDWEEKKLGNFIERSGKKNIEGRELDIYSVNNIKGFIPQDDQFDKAGYLQGISKTKYQIVNPSEFAYNPSRINVGSIGMLNKNEPVLISPMYEVFKTSDKISKGFLNHWFGTQCFQNIVHEYSVGSVRQTLKLPSLLNAKISIPCFEEQQQIAEYLSHYDEAISAAKSELELWKKLKHGYMQRMFV